MPTTPDGRPVRGLTIDAMGCLVTLDDPVPRLRALVATTGEHRDDAALRAALRIEIAHYKAHHAGAGDDAALRVLQHECAALVARELDLPGPVDDAFVDGFLDCLRFSVLPGVVPALERLRAAGVPMVVVSNWDRGLPVHLEDLGLSPFFAGVVTSGGVGVGKPDPRIFAPALELLGLPASVAAHLGDEDVDRDGAAAAGLAYLEPPVATLPDRIGVG
ncbi:HAD-IA family hydrolase [Patulibacter sp.]|uniref:HAD-IA family hydrolase n=1 Tax=Patulibacter sp. TaxID=1912859 RepID=UPI002723A741|nr:HAD-IA family hydrolase [Patulibacter sp.]MDO9407594.1 HAD-IA family hydrolase [Patulibacter sp.]